LAAQYALFEILFGYPQHHYGFFLRESGRGILCGNHFKIVLVCIVGRPPHATVDKHTTDDHRIDGIFPQHLFRIRPNERAVPYFSMFRCFPGKSNPFAGFASSLPLCSTAPFRFFITRSQVDPSGACAVVTLRIEMPRVSANKHNSRIDDQQRRLHRRPPRNTGSPVCFPAFGETPSEHPRTTRQRRFAPPIDMPVHPPHER
jgi:hypothetical protein